MPQILRAGLLIVSIALVARPIEGNAEIYEWVDSAGRTQYTNELNQVPASQRAAAEARASSRPEIIRESPAEAEVPAAEKPAEMECRPNGWCFSKGANVGFPGDRDQRGQPANPAEMKVNGQDKAGWTRLAQQFRDRIDLLERQIASLEAIGADHAPSSRHEKMSRKNFSRYWDRYGALQNARKDLSRERSSYERFMENARRAGVPPGWLR